MHPLTSTALARSQRVAAAVRPVLPVALLPLAHAFVKRCDVGWTRARSEEQTKGGGAGVVRLAVTARDSFPWPLVARRLVFAPRLK